MNLLDLLNGYKANPRNEIRKINEILKREHYVSFTKSSFETFISLLFLKSNYVSYETTFRSFYSNLIMNGDWQDGLDEKEIAVVSYTLFCELLLNLLEIKSQGLYEYYSSFSEDIVQLKSIIQNGLKSIGYKMIKKNQAYVVEKIDLVSETVASTQKEYQDFIIEYLTSKTIVEKETALTHFQ